MKWTTFIIILLAVACVALATLRIVHKCPVPVTQTVTVQPAPPDTVYIKKFIKCKPDTVYESGEIIIESDTLTEYTSEKTFTQPIQYGVVNSLVRVQSTFNADWDNVLMSDSVSVSLNMEQIKNEICDKKVNHFWRDSSIGAAVASAVIVTVLIIK
jgi:hypothetical protein